MLVTIFEDIITSGSSEVIHSTLWAPKLQGPSTLLLLWQDDRTLHCCLKYKVKGDECFLCQCRAELLFNIKADYVASIWITNRCNSFHMHGISNLLQHHRSYKNYREGIPYNSSTTCHYNFLNLSNRLTGIEKNNLYWICVARFW